MRRFSLESIVTSSTHADGLVVGAGDPARPQKYVVAACLSTLACREHSEGGPFILLRASNVVLWASFLRGATLRAACWRNMPFVYGVLPRCRLVACAILLVLILHSAPLPYTKLLLGAWVAVQKRPASLSVAVEQQKQSWQTVKLTRLAAWFTSFPDFSLKASP